MIARLPKYYGKTAWLPVPGSFAFQQGENNE
jgi:hypothetical protein